MSATAALHSLHTEARHRPTSTPKGIATAHFGELRDPLVRFIDASEVVVGCVAWLTDRWITEALARRSHVAVVVQKERWWKQTDARGTALARRYATLPGGLRADMFPAPLARHRQKSVPAIACVGYGSGSQFQPLMHHKFLVRCEVANGALRPVAVWTGSFNFSSNANDSFENAVEIHDPTIAAAYLAEFALIASLSEGLNWRYARPIPKGIAPEFVLPPTQTTANVVRKGASRRAVAKKTATRKAAASPKKVATVKALPAKNTKPATRKRATSKRTGRAA